VSKPKPKSRSSSPGKRKRAPGKAGKRKPPAVSKAKAKGKGKRRAKHKRSPVPQEQPIVYMVSLGCAKNQVDSERLAACLLSEGFLLTAHPGDADLVLVNTCAFLESAREETREVLAELQRLKQLGRLRAVVAAGCYPQKAGEVPGADEVIAFDDYPHLAARCRRILDLPPRKRSAPAPSVLSCAPRLRFGLKATAYLKISEGCDNCCAYCTIPAIRGPLRSRPVKEVLAEAEELIADGALELILIAQDTAAYGSDLPGGQLRLGELIRGLLELPGYHWLRLMYTHPVNITPELLELFGEKRVAAYLDMPIQHADDNVLALMGRGYTSDDLRRIIGHLRRRAPHMALRSTCMVGFPGETNTAFKYLCTFLLEARFDHLGAFVYSPEPGTRAARRKKQVSERTRLRRHSELMGVQKLISSGRGQERVGDTMLVLVESTGEGPALGRSQYQAPDVDGQTIITRPHAALAAVRPGEFHPVIITGATDYDLVARLI
jgi:ribosomal protein S12 methylthiotransferase